MASKTAILSVRVVSDTKNAQKGLKDTASSVEALEKGLDKMKVPAGIALGAIGMLAKGAIDAASELQQSTGAVESVFQDQAATIIDASNRAADSVGLAAAEYQNLSVILGSQLKNMGVPMDEVAGKTSDLITLGSDLAATFGGTTADAVSAVSALLRGERDPIERYGVSIKQADINARLAAEGLDGLTGDAAKAAEQQVVLAMLTEQTAAAHGQFARETDTVAGSMQIANAHWEDAKAALGEALLPAVAEVVEQLSGMAQWVAQNSDVVLALTGVVAVLAGGIIALNAAVAIYKATQTAVTIATTIWTGAQTVLNVVLSANPIGLVIGLIAALAAGIALAWNKSETFRNAVTRMWDAIRNNSGVRAIIDGVSNAMSAIAGAAQSAWNAVTNLFSNVRVPDWLGKVASFVGLSAAPAFIGASAPALSTPVTYRPSPTRYRAPAPAAPIINVTVNGALDPVNTARQIRRILTGYDGMIGGTAL